jgi:hypothetical protein
MTVQPAPVQSPAMLEAVNLGRRDVKKLPMVMQCFAEVDDTSLNVLSCLCVGEGMIFKADPFQVSATVWWMMPSGSFAFQPTAMQKLADVQDTPDRLKSVLPAGFGVGSSRHAFPFHTMALPPNPASMQNVGVTQDSGPKTNRETLTFQLLPSQMAIALLVPTWPTAMQKDALAQSTLIGRGSAAACGASGRCSAARRARAPAGALRCGRPRGSAWCRCTTRRTAMPPAPCAPCWPVQRRWLGLPRGRALRREKQERQARGPEAGASQTSSH